MKVVLDTNVLLSGLMLPDSVPGRIVAAWRNKGFELILSEPMLAEIARVLAYPKIRSRIGWSDVEIDHFVRLLRFRANVVDISGIEAEVPQDADDACVLAALIAGGAECLVTGDQDLLSLRTEYPVESLAEFARRL